MGKASFSEQLIKALFHLREIADLYPLRKKVMISSHKFLARVAIITVGELSLILDENLEVIDENWLIDVNPPYVLAIQ